MTVAPPMSARQAIRRETAISIVINMMFSLVFFYLIFGRTDPVPVWGSAAFAADLIPQSFMVALMATLVPGAIMGRKLRAGLVQPIASPSRLPRRRILRALILATVSVAVLAGAGSALLWLSGLTSIGWHAALLVKLAIGAAVAAAVTPAGLKAELRQ